LTSRSFASNRFASVMRLSREAPVPGLPADVRKVQKPKRLRLAESPLLSSLGGEPSELDQARLLGRQLQAELRKPAAKLGEEPLSVITMLEADCASRQHLAAALVRPPQTIGCTEVVLAPARSAVGEPGHALSDTNLKKFQDTHAGDGQGHRVNRAGRAKRQ
jgi:hypothetical protein